MNGQKHVGNGEAMARGEIPKKGAAEVGSAKAAPPLVIRMPHPADHPLAALYITRSLPSQLHKAKQNGDAAAVAAIEPVLVRARRIVADAERRSAPPCPASVLPPAPDQGGWAEIVRDTRRRRWR